MTEFETLVKEMRKAQNAFFRTHDYSALDRSKELERQVDKYLADLETGPDLFSEDRRFPPVEENSHEPRKESR